MEAKLELAERRGEVEEETRRLSSLQLQTTQLRQEKARLLEQIQNIRATLTKLLSAYEE